MAEEQENKFDPEVFYDKEIAPELMRLAERCHEKGLSLVVAVEYRKGEVGRTYALQKHPKRGLLMTLFSLLGLCGTNIDGYVMAVLKHCKEHNIPYDSSIVLHLLEKKPGNA